MADKIINVSWQKIISTLIVAIFIGMLSWMGATIKGGLDDINEIKIWKIETQTILNTDLANTLIDLDDAISDNTSRMGLMSADIRRLEILVNRLDVLVNLLDPRQ